MAEPHSRIGRLVADLDSIHRWGVDYTLERDPRHGLFTLYSLSVTMPLGIRSTHISWVTLRRIMSARPDLLEIISTDERGRAMRLRRPLA